MKQKLLNLLDIAINSFGSIIKTPYRIVCFWVFCLYARDIVTQAKTGPLQYTVDKFDALSKIVSKMGWDHLSLVVILVAVLASAMVQMRRSTVVNNSTGK